MILGFHHVTALSGTSQETIDFYGHLLGLKLVKRTVNFDDPATHHFYFGDAAGTPGTLLTFFPWGYHRPAKRGTGQIVRVTFAVPNEDYAVLHDPDGMEIGVVPGEGNVPKLYSVMLHEPYAESARLLELLGFERDGLRFQLPGSETYIDIIEDPQVERGQIGAGIIHHVALRVGDEATQLGWREKLIAAGFRVSHVKDRHYFHSIYFRSPSGILFEIATDGPGFLIDEPLNALGASLCLPPWLEPSRASIERRLPPIQLPQEVKS